MCGWLPYWSTSVLLSLADNLNIVRCIATEQWSGNEKVTWKCSLKTTSPPCAAVSYGHRFRCISVVSQLFALFCISYNWKAVSGFVLGGNKYLSDLIIISDSFVIWRCLCDSLQVLSCLLSLVCWKAMIPQMFLYTFIYLPPITLWAHENEHKTSLTFLSLISYFLHRVLLPITLS